MLVTLDEWKVLLLDHRRRKARYRKVEDCAREFLAQAVKDGQSVPTQAIGEALFPERWTAGDEDAARAHKVLRHVLMKLATGSMKDCAFKDLNLPAKKMYGLDIRPWRWKTGTVVKRRVCPCCGGKGWMTELERLDLETQRRGLAPEPEVSDDGQEW